MRATTKATIRASRKGGHTYYRLATSQPRGKRMVEKVLAYLGPWDHQPTLEEAAQRLRARLAAKRETLDYCKLCFGNFYEHGYDGSIQDHRFMPPVLSVLRGRARAAAVESLTNLQEYLGQPIDIPNEFHGGPYNPRPNRREEEAAAQRAREEDEQDFREQARRHLSKMDFTWAWEMLGLTRNATAAEVKQRYRELANRHHPDHGGDPIVFRMIRKAYEQVKGQTA